MNGVNGINGVKGVKGVNGVNEVNLSQYQKKIQNCSIELKICILVHFKVINSKSKEFNPKKGQKG